MAAQHPSHIQRWSLRPLVAVGLAAGLGAGCIIPDLFSGPTTTPNCPDVARTSLIAEVRDQSGRAAALGATLKIIERDYVETIGPGEIWDSLSIYSWSPRPGRYIVRVSKPGYDHGEAMDVRVATFPPCYIPTAPVIVPLTLTLQPGADPVRSIVVLPSAMGFGLPDLTEQLYAYVDANPGLDTTVTWHSSDPTVATVTATGLLRSRCRASPASATITATSVLDPTKTADAKVSVLKAPGPC